MKIEKFNDEIDIVINGLMMIINCEYNNIINTGFDRANTYKVIIAALQCVSARAVVTYAVEHFPPDDREPFFSRTLTTQKEQYLSCLQQNVGMRGVSSCLN